jgi:hypothetical protein
VNPLLEQARTRILALDDPTALFKILQDTNEETALRLLAAQRLAGHGAEGRRLLQMAFEMSEQDPAGRVAALKALVSHAPQESKPTLRQALHDPWPRVRRSARLLLQRYGDCFDPVFRLRYYLHGLSGIQYEVLYGSIAKLSLVEQRQAFQAIAQAQYYPVLPHLITTLRNFVETRTWDSGFALVHLKSAISSFANEAVPLLVTAIPGTYPVNQEYLLHALAAIETPEATAALRALSLPHNPRALERHLTWHLNRARLRNERGQKRQTYLAENRGLAATPPADIASSMRQSAMIANDTTQTYKVRQRAHNRLELWRRYNAPGKR